VTAPFPGTAILTTAVPVGLEHQAYHLFTVTAHTDGTHLGVPAKVLEMPALVAAFRPFGPAGALNLAERRFPPLFTPPVRTIDTKGWVFSQCPAHGQ